MNILAPFVRWCSTKTNEIGKHIQGNHGFCSPGCPVELVKGRKKPGDFVLSSQKAGVQRF